MGLACRCCVCCVLCVLLRGVWGLHVDVTCAVVGSVGLACRCCVCCVSHVLSRGVGLTCRCHMCCVLHVLSRGVLPEGSLADPAGGSHSSREMQMGRRCHRTHQSIYFFIFRLSFQFSFCSFYFFHLNAWFTQIELLHGAELLTSCGQTQECCKSDSLYT